MRKAKAMRGLAVATTVLVSCLGAHAASFTFFPAISLDETYTDNVNFVDEDGNVSDSDMITRLKVTLPLKRELTRGSFNMLYEGSLVQHSEEAALDHESHLIGLGYNGTPSAVTNYGLNARWSRSQSDSPVASLETPDLFLAPRSEREVYRFAANFDHQFSRFWRFTFEGEASELSFGDIPSFDNELGEVFQQDRTRWGTRTGFDRIFSERLNIGFVYGYGEFEHDATGNEDLVVDDVQSVAFVLNYQNGALTSVAIRAGGFKQVDRTGFTASVVYNRQLRTKNLSLRAQTGPSDGGSLVGSSINTIVGAVLSGRISDSWFWNTSGRYAFRTSTNDQITDVSSIGLGTGIEWRVRRGLGLRLAGNWVDQSADDADPNLEGSYVRASLGLVWYPLGTDAAQ